MLVLAPAACCLAGLALSEVTSYLATSLAASQQEGAGDADGACAPWLAGLKLRWPTWPACQGKPLDLAATCSLRSASPRQHTTRRCCPADEPSPSKAKASASDAKKAAKAAGRRSGGGGGGGFLASTWRPLPRDVAIVGLTLVFFGML